MKCFRIFALLLVVCLALSMLAGCNKDKKNEDSSSATDSKTEQSAAAAESDAASNDDQSTESDADKDTSGTESAPKPDNSQSGTHDNSDKPVITLIAKENGDGTVTISAKLPSGIGNGKVVLTVSDKLSYIEGSASSGNGGFVNDNGSFNGVAVTFATATFFDEGTTVLTANYKLSEGASLSTDDFWCDNWELGDGNVWLSNSEECDEIKFIK
ncbi:MAG: hypothetical protein IJB65_06095 [Clostridia bacterium]|nr:hypothetical protein [Clostridia bacterium]